MKPVKMKVSAMPKRLIGSRQRGISLIEIMVALLISLVLLAGFVQIFVSSKKTYQVQSNVGRLQENGRFALDVLTRNLRQAGYSDFSSDVHKSSDFVGAPSSAADTLCILSGHTRFICGTNGSGTESDWVQVSFDASKDCLGNALPSAAEGVAVNRFTIDSNGNLACLGNGNASSQPMVEGVQEMRIRYGISSGGKVDQVATRYIPAPSAGSTDWDRVVSVRLCLIIRSLEDNQVDKPLDYQDCSDAKVTPTDRRMRRRFTATINTRNRGKDSPALW